MDPTVAARRLAMQQYAAVREALTLFEERVVARYWDEESPVRAGFGRFLGSLDETAGRLLADDEISRRGEARLRRTTPGITTGTATTTEAGAADRPEAEVWTVAAQEPPPEAVIPPSRAAEPDTAGAGNVEVAFTLPAEVEAERVALCGDFNGWSTDDIFLERGSDGAWRATVTLEPGRSYRYRYLLDGERWENAWHADRYVPNSYGSVDSVVVVD